MKHAILDEMIDGVFHAEAKCDCEGQILHNNGGNYHERVKITYDSYHDQFFIESWSTSDFEDNGPGSEGRPVPCTVEQAYLVVRKAIEHEWTIIY